MKEIIKTTVSYHGRTVGSLLLSPDWKRCVFGYDKSWIADGFSLSPLELPLQDGLFYADESFLNGCFAVFEDSMPDGYGLYLLDRMLRADGLSLRELTPLQRLSLIGSAGMGALDYQPASLPVEPVSVLEDTDFDDLQAKALEIFSEKNEADASFLYHNSHNSGGARPKAVVRRKDGSNWIVKFRHVYDPEDIGLTEYRHMKVAELCGIKVARPALVKGKYFACQRFDIEDGVRLHTVTAAALMKTDFRAQTADYTNLLALTGYLTQDPAQVEQMFRLMVFNIVSLNKDDHAKNFSFIYREDPVAQPARMAAGPTAASASSGWQLAPAYDLTYSPEGTRGEHSTSVFFNGNPGLEDVLRAGTGIRIPRKHCLEIVEEIQAVCSARLSRIQRLI